MVKLHLIFALAFLTHFAHCEEWIKWSTNKTSVPKDSVLVASDIAGSYYVIRAESDGEVSPGKFSPELQQAFISNDGQTVGNLKEFEVK